MNTTPIVYDIALIPPPVVNDAALKLSAELQPLGAEFVLQANRVYPHISLYMANFRDEDLPHIHQLLATIVSSTPKLSLTATTLANNDEGMYEIFYQKSSQLTSLQEAIIAQLNPLRQGLRITDPVGRHLADYITQVDGEQKDNLTRYGYDEVGILFKPHITITRFVARGKQALVVPSLPPQSFSGQFNRLGLFEMGEHGTCIRQLLEWSFE